MKSISQTGLPKAADVKAFAADVSSIANVVFGGWPTKDAKSKLVSPREVADYFGKYDSDEMALIIRESPLWAAAEVLGLSRDELERDSTVWAKFRKWQDERNRVTENQIALAVCQIAAEQPDYIATFSRLKRDIPKLLRFSALDRARSITRPNEEMWEQLIRNIKSHSESPGNYIYEGFLEHIPKTGYFVTKAGRLRAERGIP